MKPAALRPLAEADLIERAQHYRHAGGRALAERFFEAAIDALRLAEANPGVGSPRVGELIDVPGLRRVAVAGFPCGWLYVERDEAIDVVRLLADPQDLGAALGLRDG